jgi:hypothetical protein
MTQTEALTQALVLAIVAPDDEKSQKALKLAQGFSKGLSSATVAKCKAEALSVIEAWGKV